MHQRKRGRPLKRSLYASEEEEQCKIAIVNQSVVIRVEMGVGEVVGHQEGDKGPGKGEISGGGVA